MTKSADVRAEAVKKKILEEDGATPHHSLDVDEQCYKELKDAFGADFPIRKPGQMLDLTGIKKKRRLSTASVTSAGSTASRPPLVQTSIVPHVPTMKADDIEKMSVLVMRFICGCGLPIQVVGKEPFKQLIRALNPVYASSGLPGRTCMMERYLPIVYKQVKRQVDEITDKFENR